MWHLKSAGQCNSSPFPAVSPKSDIHCSDTELRSGVIKSRGRLIPPGFIVDIKGARVVSQSIGRAGLGLEAPSVRFRSHRLETLSWVSWRWSVNLTWSTDRTAMTRIWLSEPKAPVWVPRGMWILCFVPYRRQCGWTNLHYRGWELQRGVHCWSSWNIFL